MDFLKRHISLLAACAVTALLFSGWSYLFSPPFDFPSGSIIAVPRGAPAPEIAQELADMHIVAHPTVLKLIFRITGTGSQVQAGAYLFPSPQNVLVVAYRLITGSYDLPPVRITFPEGTTARDMAVQVNSAFPAIAQKEFLAAAQPFEGYLFPDTYLFSPSSDAASIVANMRANFNVKILPLSPLIAVSGHSLADTVTMASLIEKEARTSAVRHIVSGILWNRLRLGMPLQVDAVFGYIFARDTYSPSFADLKVNSPYNTYTHTGLPPGPIDNPSFDSLDAAASPTKTDYLYYLVDKNGVIHYATTYAGHQANRAKYLP